MTQLYLLKISAMSTCDECDVVPSAEIIVDRDFSTKDLPLFEALQAMVRQLSEAMTDAPLENVRPMTRDEIQAYRDDENDPETSVRLA
jgi:hypothetical protein